MKNITFFILFIYVFFLGLASKKCFPKNRKKKRAIDALIKNQPLEFQINFRGVLDTLVQYNHDSGYLCEYI